MTRQSGLIGLILADHESFKRQLPQVISINGGERSALFDQLTHDLVVHEILEEEVVWPAVRQFVPDGHALAGMRTKEESEAEAALKELVNMDRSSKDFETKYESFREDVLLHAQNEEDEVFPQLYSAVDGPVTDELANWWQRAKSEIPQLSADATLAQAEQLRETVRNAR